MKAFIGSKLENIARPTRGSIQLYTFICSVWTTDYVIKIEPYFSKIFTISILYLAETKLLDFVSNGIFKCTVTKMHNLLKCCIREF